jgi:hypothetical protein
MTDGGGRRRARVRIPGGGNAQGLGAASAQVRDPRGAARLK